METNKNNGKLCAKELKSDEETVFCMGPCHKKVHSKCVGFTPTALKFYRQCKNLSYECDDCLDDPNKQINETLSKLLSFMCIVDERLNRQETNSERLIEQIATISSVIQNNKIELKTEIDKLTVNDRVTESTFVEAEKKTSHEPAMIIRPKKHQKWTVTRDDINKKIIPNNFALSSVNNMSKGGIQITCKNNEDLKKIHEKAMEVMADGYTVVAQKIRNPKVRVTNMTRKLNADEIIEGMKRDNEFLKEAALKVLCVYDIKNTESFGSIIEVDPKTYNQIVQERSVVIGMNKCNVTECLNVLRCYKCCGYNHKANVCVNKMACLRCGGEHQIKDCKSKSSKCINCKTISEKLKLNWNTNHPVWSRECSVLKKKRERAKRFVNYSG